MKQRKVGTLNASDKPVVDLVRPPQSWKSGTNHLESLINEPWYQHLSSIASTVFCTTVDFFETAGASSISVPATTMSVSSPMGLGSDSLPVKTKINGNTVYLADSQQFQLELGLRIAGKSQYYISNSFRGEDVDDTHLSEFSHAEIEIFGDLENIITLAENYIRSLVKALIARNSDDIIGVVGNTDHLLHFLAETSAFKRIRFDDAMEMVGETPGMFEEIAPGILAITRQCEQFLMTELGAPLWLTHMPTMACPFYQRPVGNGAFCSSADLLLGPGEILGSGARCVDAEEVRLSIARHEVRAEDYDWYISMKEMKPMETAGFGLGLERFYMWVMQTDDIRDCTMWIRRNGEVLGP